MDLEDLQVTWAVVEEESSVSRDLMEIIGEITGHLMDTWYIFRKKKLFSCIKKIPVLMFLICIF